MNIMTKRKNIYVALAIRAIAWIPGTSFPQTTQAAVSPQSRANSPAPSG
ncbi:hypothetical protein [Terriglobus albidus]|nr:hypothetical protein [Terriglobus albidus]